MSLRFVTSACLLLAAPAFAAPPAAVTIYTRDLAFVRESRTLVLGGGRDTLRLGEIPDRIDVSSVRLTPAGKARVTRLAYRFDVASGDRLLELARGARVRISLRENRTVEGTLVGADGAWVMVRTDDRALESVSRAAIDQLRLAPAPAGLAFEPALEAVVEGGTGRTEAELAYLTGGLSWTAEHSLIRTSETAGQWTSTVAIENTSGRTYEVPRLALVAGQPRREAPPASPVPMARMEMSMAAAKADLGEQSFAEYHLYTLDRPALLRDRETQSLVMIETRPVQLTPRYLYRGGGQGVTSQLELTNNRAAGLGVPIPEGRVRIYENDPTGARHFTGENHIGHTAEGEKLTLEVGTAFDLVAERREVTNRRISDREREYQVEIKLRNHKKGNVTIVVEEPVTPDHEVVQKSHPFTLKDASTLRFEVPVPAGKETVLTYTVRARW
jgi:hypothetical protein